MNVYVAYTAAGGCDSEVFNLLLEADRLMNDDALMDYHGFLYDPPMTPEEVEEWADGEDEFNAYMKHKQDEFNRRQKLSLKQVLREDGYWC